MNPHLPHPTLKRILGALYIASGIACVCTAFVLQHRTEPKPDAMTILRQQIPPSQVSEQRMQDQQRELNPPILPPALTKTTRG